MKMIQTAFLFLGPTLALTGMQLFAVPAPPPEAPATPPAEASRSPAVDPLVDSAKSPARAPSVARPEAAKPEGELRDLTAAPDETTPPVEVEVEQRKEKIPSPRRVRTGRDGEREVVAFGDAYLAQGEKARTVVAIMGNAQANGPVQDAVVAVMGDSTARYEVGDTVVAVMGNATAEKSVGDAVVAVMGNASANGRVGGTVVAVFGDVLLGPNADVHGDVVSVGGRVIRDPSAIIRGQINEVAFLRHLSAFGSSGLWFREAIFRGRLLALKHHLIWPWAVAFSFLGFYLLLALGFAPTLTRCADTLEQRPFKTVFAALLALVATPALMVVLLITVIGAAAVFFAVMAALLVGKAAFLTWLGRRIAKPLGISNVAGWVLVGGLLVVVLYTIPVIGLLVWMLGSTLGLGMAVYTTVLTTRRDRAVRTLPPELRPSQVSPGLVAAVGASGTPFPPANPTGSSSPLPLPPVGQTVGRVPPPLSFAGLARAGFWIRLAASILDAILVGLAVGVLHLDDLFLLFFTAYCIMLWAKKGTTVGGIICGLKVVRLDERPLDFGVALVRALGAFLSLAVAGLGFIWVAFDDDKQSWHDKICGTTIVRVPKGVSLI